MAEVAEDDVVAAGRGTGSNVSGRISPVNGCASPSAARAQAPVSCGSR